MALALAADDSAAVIQAKLAREQDPVKRAQLQLKLAGLRLDDATRFYRSGDDAKGLAALKEMLGLSEQVEKGLFATGRDPRKKPKGFKDAEIAFRKMHRKLVDLRVTLPVDERPVIEEIIRRIDEMHDEFLYGIMKVKDSKP